MTKQSKNRRPKSTNQTQKARERKNSKPEILEVEIHAVAFGGDGIARHRDVPGHHAPGPRLRRGTDRRRDGDLAGGPAHLWRPRARVPGAPGGHHAHPGARRQHGLRRLPAAFVDHRPRWLHPTTVPQPRGPAGVLERHHRSRRMRRRARRRNGREGRPLQKTIDENIKKPLSKEILFGKLTNGGIVEVSVKNGELLLNFLDILSIKKLETTENVTEN